MILVISPTTTATKKNTMPIVVLISKAKKLAIVLKIFASMIGASTDIKVASKS